MRYTKDAQFDVGYYKKNKKLWINCSQDLGDAWSIVSSYWWTPYILVCTDERTLRKR